jgi:DNA-binding NtrC family response regulator
MQKGTYALEYPDAQPVQTLVVQVVDGPDKGTEAQAKVETLTVGTANGNDLELSDKTVSRYHLELNSDGEGIRIVDCGSTNGTWFGAARIDNATVPGGSIVMAGNTRLRLGRGDHAVAELHKEDRLGGLRGRSTVMRRVMARVKKAADQQIPILVVGESGTGKELIAQALHDGGCRRDGPFVTVDCGTLTEGLVATALLGHERGAFTGADHQQVGAFELADGGTILLDEIGDLPTTLQASLLGVLERRRFRRVGGRDEISTDVRIIAATNRDLRAEVNAGSFRLDLYYRLAVGVLSVPPLRGHPEDIPLLVQHFLELANHDGPLQEVVSDDVMQRLLAYRWPGNVRELRNMVEVRLAMGEPVHIPSDPVAESSNPGESGPPSASSVPPGIEEEKFLDLPFTEARAASVQSFEERYLRRLIRNAEGNVSLAARQAKMNRSHLTELLRRHGLR